MVCLSTYWVLKEARRIAQQKELTRATNAHLESDMVWLPAGGFTMGGIGRQHPAGRAAPGTT